MYLHFLLHFHHEIIEVVGFFERERGKSKMNGEINKRKGQCSNYANV